MNTLATAVRLAIALACTSSVHESGTTPPAAPPPAQPVPSAPERARARRTNP